MPDTVASAEARPTIRRRRRPVVSVCVVNWNCREMLRACLASLSPRLQGLRLEIVVVDNASADGAADMVAAEFPRVKLVRNADNVGFARGNNQAAAVARGRFLLFLNNDTVVPPGELRRLCVVLKRNPSFALVGPRLRSPTGEVQHSVRRHPTAGALLHRLTLLRWTGLFRRPYDAYRGREMPTQTAAAEVVMGAAMLMRRDTFAELGGWDEGFVFGGEDTDLCRRAAGLGAVVHEPGVEIIHHGREASRLNAGFAHAHTLVGVVRCLRRSGTPWATLATYKLLFLLDLPLRAAVLAVQAAAASVRGRAESARRARLDLSGMAYFVRHALGAFLWA